MGDVVRLVGEVMEAENLQLPPMKLATLVEMAYNDTIEHDGKPRPEHIRRLVKLVK